METWVVGNWKMNGSLGEVGAFVPALLSGLPEGWQASGVRVAICPPHPYLAALRDALAGSRIDLGAQRVHALPAGAYTGEVSPPMLRDFGATLCIVGHSEHRQHFGVSDAMVAERLHGLWQAEVMPVLCVGETLEEREAGKAQAVIQSQLLEAFRASSEERVGRRKGDIIQLPHPEAGVEHARQLIVAYEPVWAIGTGKTATPEQANEMHAFLRGLLVERFGAGTAGRIPLLYGGSVNPGNAGTLMAQPEIDGTLVGGASLKADSFLSIIEQSLN